jgi:hypothetical protein
MPAGMELLLWLALLLVDATIALRDLLRQHRVPSRVSRSTTGNIQRVPATSWLGADLNPASLA